SGRPSDLDALATIANRQGISLTVLKSRYPYHSSFLAGAVAPFRAALEAYDFTPASIPVYLCMEGMLYSPGSDLAQILSSQFVRTLDFSKVVSTLYASGYRTFIECGAGNIATRLIGQNLIAKADEIEAFAVTPLDGSVRQGRDALLARGFGKKGTTPAPTDAAQLLERMSLVVDDVSRLVADTAHLVEQIAGSADVTPAPVSAPTKDGSAAIAAEVPLQPAVVPAPISTGRSQGEKSSTPDTSRIKTAVAGSNGSGGSGSLSASIRHEQAAFAHEEGSEIPVAI